MRSTRPLGGGHLISTQSIFVAVPAPSLSAADPHLDALGARLGVRVIALAPAMQSAYYRPSGAWTADGHRAAADAVAARLCGATARPD